VTPYRSARVEGRPLDPSRPRFGLAGAAVGAVCAFASLMDLGLNHRFTPVDSVLLFGGSAALANSSAMTESFMTSPLCVS